MSVPLQQDEEFNSMEESLIDTEPEQGDYFSPVTAAEPHGTFVETLRFLLSNFCVTTIIVSIYLTTVFCVGVVIIIEQYQNSVSKQANDSTCHDIESLNKQWVIWATVSIVRMGLVAFAIRRRYLLVDVRGLGEMHTSVKLADNGINLLECLGIIWFVLGNLWLLSRHHYVLCGLKYSSVYIACLGILTLQYIQLCLPCLAAFGLIPIFCCCLPSFVRLMDALRDTPDKRVDTLAYIANLPVVVYNSDSLLLEKENTDDATCSVCISDFHHGDRLRLLPCKHMFHIHCVDNWLVRSATCPNCRSSIIPTNNDLTQCHRNEVTLSQGQEVSSSEVPPAYLVERASREDIDVWIPTDLEQLQSVSET